MAISNLLSKLWGSNSGVSMKPRVNKRTTLVKKGSKVIPLNDRLPGKLFQDEYGFSRLDETGMNIEGNFSKYRTTFWLQNRHDKYILKCIEAIQTLGIQTEGLFRISGNLALVDDVYQKIISTDSEIFIVNGLENNVHNISSLLKKLLRLYPNGLIPEQALKTLLLNWGSHPFLFLKHIPDGNYNIIRVLFSFLSTIAVDCIHVTLMDTLALSIVFAPNIASYDHITDPAELKQTYQLVQKVIERLIQRGIDDPCYWMV